MRHAVKLILMFLIALLGPSGAHSFVIDGFDEKQKSSSGDTSFILTGSKPPPQIRLPKAPKQKAGTGGKVKVKPSTSGAAGNRRAVGAGAAGRNKALPVRNAFGTAVGKPGAYRHMNRTYKIPTKESRLKEPLFKSLPQKIDRSKVKISAKGFTLRNVKKNRGGPKNAEHHYKLHGKNFSAKSVADYVRKAQRFRNNPPAGTERRVLKGGDVALYNKKTNTLLIHNRVGAIKTFYKPGPKQTKNGRGFDPKKYKNAYDFFKKGVK